ncbi:MAG: exodeoxyribonuclease VII large subunit [Anaerolineales bacterium]
MISPLVWTVSGLNRYVRTLLDNDESLQDLWVEGELSNVSRPSSGHLYFTLKDSDASVRCVMWRESASRQSIPAGGQRIEVHGRASLYEVGGQYQLYVDLFRPAGEGALFARFLALKAKLEAEGLFDPARKRPLPAWPRRIGVVTSASGAALQDVLTVLSRRFPLAEVVLAPASVQGDSAPAEIVAALRAADRAAPDVILLVRGGGSLEDLWAFNEEVVVRAIVGCRAPVVTGVGHETDTVLADFAADRRAPTPSAAAELVTPDRLELEAEQSSLVSRLDRDLDRWLRENRAELGAQEAYLRSLSPRAQLDAARQLVDDLHHRLGEGYRGILELQRADLGGLVNVMRSVNPLEVLRRGYAIVTREGDGAVVTAPRQAPPGTSLAVRVRKGSLRARVVARSE